MQTPDLSPLIKGVLAVVGLSIVLGQYSKLERWARNQALHAVAWREPLPYFFAPAAHRAPRAAPSARPHRHAGT